MLGRIKSIKPFKNYAYIAAVDGTVFFMHFDGFRGELDEIKPGLRVTKH
jgi:hypothetical protein